ncbi:hypothetical protein ACSBR1_011269 [Camellia fascicularis]
MSWLMFLLHQFLLLFLLSSSSTCARHTCLEDQRFSLLQFKTTFTITANASLGCESDSHPKMVFWNESSDCCSWEGVTCDWSNGHVIGLDLSCSHLQGTIQPNTTLFYLRQLQTLNLAFNDFNFSAISPDFGSFPSLTHLNLSYSNFTGLIPSKICYLSKLVSLDLSYFNYYPQNPYDSSYSLARLEQHTFNMLLRNLTQLRELHLDSLNISSPLPHALLNLSSLTSLSLRYCQLRGKFSENIFHFPNLRELCVSGNSELTGKLPYFNVTSSLQFLDLFRCNFSGSIPASLGNLTQITYLDFGYNSFSGQIPSSISNLAKLNPLYLDGNNLTGQIPDSLGNMSQLTILYLSENNLNGQIPDSLGNMSQLTILDLSQNNLNGQIPDSLGNMSQLTILDLSQNNLNGQIPDSLGNMSQLTQLYLFSNQLTGTIPSSLFALPSLVEIDLSKNKLQGPIPGLVYELQNLTFLLLSSNNLSGVVHLDKLLKLKNLIYLDLSYNGLSLSINNSVNSTLTNFDTIGLASCNLSEFPIFLREQASLCSLDLSNNKIHGEVPKWLFDVGKDSLYNLTLSHNFLTSLEHLPWKNLAYIDLNSNLLRGPLPVPPNTTNVFSISNNKLTGEIPPLICDLKSLVVLDLSNNSLSGLIPQCLGNLRNSLSVLNLGINSFHGMFTATFTKGNVLRNLNLNGNQIEGQVPRSLLNCRHLEVLDLGKNKINDTFPHWLGTLRNLQVLVLRFNMFHGPVGTFKTKGKHPFPKLRIIDISYNEFTGLLPTNYIKQFEAMMNADEHQMKLKYMDIPKSIGRLNSLRGLNLSHNNLKGHIPTLFGNLTNLESLDLSSNELVGEIPQQLTSLKFLAVLNLSDNQLVGQIPQGSQFNTFGNDSYNGNLALCGFPLSKKCEEQQPFPPPPTLQHDENLDWEGRFNWKVVVMGYGCGFVFGIVMGYLMLVTRSPEWLMKIVEGKQYKKVKRSKKSKFHSNPSNRGSCMGNMGHREIVPMWLDMMIMGMSFRAPSKPIAASFHLRQLQRLNLAFNDFRFSRISSKFGSFMILTRLNLATSLFSSRIPSEISYLSKLISLDFSGIHEGRLEQHTFSMLLQNLIQLRELHLDALDISLPLPLALLNQFALTSLSPAFVNCVGIPRKHFPPPKPTKSLRKVPNFNITSSLQIIDLSRTSFSGQVPGSISNLKALNSVYLIECNFSGGQIPLLISNLAKFTHLFLSNNNLNGQILDSIGNMSQLAFLDLYRNQLIGPIPLYAIGLSRLAYLDLKNNSLNRTIPSWLFTLPSLVSIELRGNKFQGQIPGSFYELANLTHLSLSSNNLGGIVELDKLLTLKYLSHLDLSHNGLSLSINNSWFKTLQFIDLHSNLLHGPLPIPPITTIAFSVSNNKLIGEILPLICSLNSLKVLDLSNNNFSGIIPHCLGNFSNSLLVLNSFHGTLTAAFTKGNMLRNLNLNGNQIEGQVPRSLLNCEHMEVLDLGINKINDTFPHWLGTLLELFHGHIDAFKTKSKVPFTKLRIIDICYNEFSSPLPNNYIEKFESMMNVMGEIYYQDSVVVVMKGFEIEYSRILMVFSIIDLSSNNFQGDIPKSIAKLNSLRGLNLSHNNPISQLHLQI